MKKNTNKPKIKYVLFSLTFACQLTAQATFTPEFPRGEELVQISVPGKNPEVCVIPKHFIGADYSKKDKEKEQALCSLNEYQNVGVCGKTNSTNPGLLFFSVPGGMTPAQLESAKCEHKDSELVAKYKLSTSCSYAPSLIAYYHVSRILGGVAKVPPAVLRTFDRDRHLAIGKNALAKTEAGSLINQTWGGLVSILKSGEASAKKDLIFTDKFDQSYGALQVNPTGEEFYSEFFVKGTDRVVAFRDKSAVAQLLKTSKPASDFVGRKLDAANLQKMVAMQDASEMIILDTLLNQQDRFGNIHFKNEMYVMDAQGNLESKGKKEMTPEELAKAVTVKRMVLKDNDCGVSKENRAKKAALASIIGHVDPKTYKRLMMLDGVADDPNTAAFFKQNMMFTSADYTSFRTNLKELATQMKKACEAGKLKLDLDLDNHFSGGPLAQHSCDSN